ncbi:MAG: hypothetical protein KGL39_56235 [Patescibacteria group bacterium]|nr:hypothetical protein [Patescibacteria group bacterium]
MAIAGTVGLAGCGLTNPFTNQPISTADVQNAAVAACGFLPTASTVAQIISVASGGAGAGIVDTVEGVASAICAAVVPAKAGRLRGAPMVAGVTVHGKWVR